MNNTKIIEFIAKRTLQTVLFLLFIFCSCSDKKQNRLAVASSPYLREHADNPVDWYEWGDEALQLAKEKDKPLLISVGYSSCHWCHTMEKESFMDTAVARLMNENFICIKVDREERPDIDNVYSHACQLISGSSGWPLNAFALPDGKPFFAGTYYSKQSWINLISQISSAYKTQRNKVELQATTLSHGIANLEFSVLTDSTSNISDKKLYQNLFENLYQKMDLAFGGLKGSPKFPMPSSLEFLLQYYFLTKEKRALDAVTTTLTKMALGGIYDHVGGGFARYSVDSLWRIPHFEKMLYDNAQLITVYAHAYQLTGNDFFKRIAEETADFVQRDLANSNGGYFSSVNADTKEGEGVFYTWAYEGFRKNLPDNHKLLAGYYNISERGNWKENKNVLFASETPVQFAEKNNMNPENFSRQLAASKKVLLTTRNKKEKPSVDDKILTSWNALLMKGFLDAYAAFGDETYLQQALAMARFLEKNMLQKDGKLWRSFKDGKTSVSGFLDDYAFLSRAYIRLYQLTFDKHWLLLSQQLANYALKEFYDPNSKMFFYTAQGGKNDVIRKIEIADNNTPSSNAAMAEVLYALGTYFENNECTNLSKMMLSKIYRQLQKEGTNYYASWCSLAGLFSFGSNEVAIMGKDALAKSVELQKNYLPISYFMGSVREENLPLLEGKQTDARTMIFVCINKTCKQPVEETGRALEQLLIKGND